MSTVSSDLKCAEVNGHSISYDDHGAASAPVVVMLSGWCQDHRLFDPLLPHLTDTHRVIRIDWRGHGIDRTPVADFGYPEQADDVIAVLDLLGVDIFLPVSTSHGGWANIEVAERLGARRVPRSIVIDWIMTPPPADFAAGLAAIQDRERWTEGRQDLFDTWLNGSSNAVVAHHLDKEMAGFDFEMWARSCRVIANGYERWGSPLLRMNALAEQRPVRHLFSQPTADEYVRAQQDFGAEHPWFSYHQVGGETHFPTLDSPQTVAEQIRGFGSGDDTTAG
ncbi:alpha/beta hydrolase [Streptomyces sp. BE147]|uniref:alpha/beta fold hydrolase n=1 Tax=unclassified Streptomyces TaxID=2593676 RepID=UPI002E75AC5F|nr:alpha/beta hydrolase [Streptomyces sp. BE147]MEE1736897.1 alpha/beta hydrolase [Streptomyces sp. BE147]